MTKEMKKKLEGIRTWCEGIRLDYAGLLLHTQCAPKGVTPTPADKEMCYYVRSGIENIAAAFGTVVKFNMLNTVWCKEVHIKMNDKTRLVFCQVYEYSEVMKRW